jgi:hypothetical protein
MNPARKLSLARGIRGYSRVKIYDHRLEDNGVSFSRAISPSQDTSVLTFELHMWNYRGYFALKKLRSHEPKNFKLELSSLLSSVDHNRSREHMIQVIATFEEVNPGDHQSTFLLLFDWAEGNLKDFW